MLKKAGIIVATAAAGLLALSPLAFAHDDESFDFVNVEDSNQTNDCAFGADGGSVDSESTGGSGLLAGGAVANAIAPITTQTQALNCTNLNVEDVIDQDSNNSTSTVEETEIEDSFNR